MDPARPSHGNLTYDVLVIALVAVMAIGAVLLFMAFGPRPPAAFTVGAGNTSDCPFDTNSSPNCYVFTLENTGGTEGYVRCRVKPTGDSEARFSNGDRTYARAIPMQPGEQYALFTKIKAGPSEEIPEPDVSCRSL
jgi:hypothetical protein